MVVDDENRENEGDLICAAQFATPDMINFMAVNARGLICLAMTGERLDALDLPLMVTHNTDSNQTAFTVSIDASPHLGVSTGISAEDRARTIQVALNPDSLSTDLRRPGHIFPPKSPTRWSLTAGRPYRICNRYDSLVGFISSRCDLRNSKS